MEFSPPPKNPFVVDNSERARLTILLFRVVAVVLLLSSVIYLSALFSVDSTGILSPLAAMSIAIFSLASLIPVFLLSIFFFLWIHRAYKNLHFTGVDNLPYSPGWAIASWFIPFVNFFLPYQVVKNTWINTQRSYREDEFEPRKNSVLNYWWALYILASILTVINSYMVDPRQLEVRIFITLISNVLLLFSAIFGAKCVKEIAHEESEMMLRLEKDYEVEFARAEKQFLLYRSLGGTAAVNSFEEENRNPLEPTRELVGDFTENGERSKLLKPALSVLVGILAIYGGACLYSFVRPPVFYFVMRDFSNEIRQYMVLSGFFVLMFTGIILMMWMKRAYSNLHALNIPALSFKQEFAVRGWFIPGGNFIIPFLILRDINFHTQNEIIEHDPFFRKPIVNQFLLLFSWCLICLAFFLQFLCVLTSGIIFTPPISYLFGALGAAAGIGGLCMFIYTLKNINKAEVLLFEKVERENGNSEEETFEEETFEEENPSADETPIQ